MPSYAEILAARTNAVTSQTARLRVFLDTFNRSWSNLRNRSTSEQFNYLRSQGHEAAPTYALLERVVERLQVHYDNAGHNAGWNPLRWGSIPPNREAIRASAGYGRARTALTQGNRALERYRASPMWAVDNQSAWAHQRLMAGLSSRRVSGQVADEVGRTVGRAASVPGQVIGGAARGTAEGIGKGWTSAGRDARTGGQGQDQEQQEQQDADPAGGGESWDGFVWGMVGLTTLLVGGGIAVGIAQRKGAARVAAQRATAKKLEAHRKSLRK